MQLHELKPKHKLKERKRVGRGGKRGTYSGRGVKGQKSRSGAKFQPVIRELIKKYPKLRGYRFNALKKKFAIVNVRTIEEKFESGDKISPDILLERRLIRRINGRVPGVKILGNGKLTKSLIIDNCQLSETAKEKIEKAGGKINV